MCGIGGVWFFDPSAAVPHDLLVAMADRMRHRGPDDEGYLLVNTTAGTCEQRRGADTDAHLRMGAIHQPGDATYDLAFCFRRLSIIDLSPAGHQPMGNDDGSTWIVFNGEIYNYIELRRDLEAKGHAFHTATDTEVILKAYEEWGVRCLERFNGMWAFALWDGRRSQLFCARDRLGIKPFQYYADERRFCFASEIKALLPALPAAPSPNLDYLAYFLTGGDLGDGEETVLSDVRNLLPGHYLLLQGGQVSVSRYWDLAAEVARQTMPAADTAAADEFRTLLTDAVRLRLRSDVPVGTCLSGGLDSSTIVGLLGQMLPHAVKTFSAVYADPDCDEERFIQAAVQQVGADAYQVTPDGEDLADLLPQIAWHMDGPTEGPSVYTQWHVMQLAHGKVTVLLDGQGGDELLGGYPAYFPIYLRDRVRQRLALGRLPADVRRISAVTGISIPRLLARTARPWLSRLSHTQRERLMPSLHPAFRAVADAGRIVRHFDRVLPAELDSTLYWDLVKRRIPHLLHFEDRNSMAFSLEARVPFLDYRLVSFCLALPLESKIRGAITKHVLRESMRDVLPQAIRERTDKKGYPTPAARWFRGHMADYVRSVLFDPRTRQRQVLAPAVVGSMLTEHNAGRANHAATIWRWLTTELWFRQVIDQAVAG